MVEYAIRFKPTVYYVMACKTSTDPMLTIYGRFIEFFMHLYINCFFRFKIRAVDILTPDSECVNFLKESNIKYYYFDTFNRNLCLWCFREKEDAIQFKLACA
jgi:hypothetical protein